MATRLYAEETGATPHASPAFDAAWDVTSGATRRYLTVGKRGVGIGSGSLIGTKAAVGPLNLLCAQLILPGLDAQTIDGYVKGQFRWNASSALLDGVVQTVIRVVDPATGTVRGTLLSAIDPGTGNLATAGAVGYELPAGAANRKVPSGWSGSGTALTPVVAQAGDWLVVELGARVYDSAATSRQATLFLYKNPATSDYPEDETTTSSLNSWLEFSGTIATTPRGVPRAAVTPVPRRFVGVSSPLRGQLWPRGGRGV